jgi:hypothetical protein
LLSALSGKSVPVPRYHFNIYDGISAPDRVGTELPDLQTARQEAVRLAGELLADHAEWFWSGQKWRLEVANSSGHLLFSLDFMAADSPATTGRMEHAATY